MIIDRGVNDLEKCGTDVNRLETSGDRADGLAYNCKLKYYGMWGLG